LLKHHRIVSFRSPPGKMMRLNHFARAAYQMGNNMPKTPVARAEKDSSMLISGAVAAGGIAYMMTDSKKTMCDENYPPTGIADGIKKLPKWIQLGCGDEPYYCTEKEATFGFDHDCPAQMPDLSKHSNFMAEFFVKNPDVYDRLKDKKTKNGVTLADC